MHRRHLLLCALATLAPRTSFAAPTPYRLGAGGATITYTFMLSGAPVKGTIPVSQADLQVDPNNLSASTAVVRADVRRARTGLIFATEALKSESVLDAATHPTAQFRSTRVRVGPGGRISDGATLEGDLTLRGVTRPVRFDAGLFRARGSAADDFSQLTVMLKGRVDRRDFGAIGYPDLVDNTVGIDITAEISARG
ncbi:YceI family protein [Tateyamaria omphalii]|uniref:YceI family protein n=1 Tax=Tateyamaria omphalii TaxID=299262 RepID=UPI001C99D6A3|nr:YceI family protein [Tateyamaria omphalii]MBY5932014.1 YceI family protein [Tateyamaria omphalii]